MTSITDIDPYFIKSISCLHSHDHLQGRPALQLLLEEAIKAKTGIEKNFTPLIQSILKQSGIEEYKNVSAMEESRTTSSSDNELELDLLKEDLMCIVCQGMDVGARNRLLECSECHHLYHQECHQPPVTQQDAEGLWVCNNCKESKRAKKSPGHSSKSKMSSSTSPRHSSGYKSSSKSGSSKSSSGKSSSSKSSSSSSSSRHSATPSINIAHADKRLQNMKKKAAKLHEKKKLPR